MRVPRKTVLTLGAAAIVLAPLAASAATATTVVNAVIASSISTFTTTSPVTINLAPTASPDQVCASDTVTVTTNAANGYSLSIQDNNVAHTTAAQNTLANGANTLANATATFASPAVLPTNAWGWREDSHGSFGAGPTSTTGANCTSRTFSLVPQNAAPQLLSARATGPYAGNTHTVWYSAKADITKPNGTYTGTVLYTALAL